jgi:acyl dehydratase
MSAAQQPNEKTMTKQNISADLVGLKFDPVPVSWSDNDVMLYALGVGATPAEDLEFVYEGKGPKVIPTYGVIPGMTCLMGLNQNVDINLMMILHGEQSIELKRPLPAKVNNGTAVGSITEVWDKGKAAVIGVECEVSDDDGPIFSTHSTIFVRGAGGFGGERGPSSKGVNEPPARDPDHVVEYKTLPQQGALYRLTGDRVPLHIDPEFAKMAGYDKPFMHGLCTYGFVCRAVLESCCDKEPDNFTSLSGRFADQVWFGDSIITKIWNTGPGEAIVQAETQTGAIVISQAKATFKAQ